MLRWKARKKIPDGLRHKFISTCKENLNTLPTRQTKSYKPYTANNNRWWLQRTPPTWATHQSAIFQNGPKKDQSRPQNCLMYRESKGRGFIGHSLCNTKNSSGIWRAVPQESDKPPQKTSMKLAKLTDKTTESGVNSKKTETMLIVRTYTATKTSMPINKALDVSFRLSLKEVAILRIRRTESEPWFPTTKFFMHSATCLVAAKAVCSPVHDAFL